MEQCGQQLRVSDNLSSSLYPVALGRQEEDVRLRVARSVCMSRRDLADASAQQKSLAHSRTDATASMCAREVLHNNMQ